MSSRAIVSNKFVEKQRKPPKRLSNLAKLKKQIITQETAKLNAQYKWTKSKKGLTSKFFSYIEHSLKKIEPLELVALIGTTYMVKATIDKSEELLGAIKRDFTPIWKEEFAPHWEKALFGIPQLTIWKETVSVPLELLPDWQEWLISFAIAYIIVKHGGQILGLLGSGLTGIIKLFLIG